MPKPFNQREYDLFLSHAHADRVFVENVKNWLTGPAGLKVFYDPETGTSGSGISTMLQDEIVNSRGMLMIVSDASVESGWVQDEYNIAKEEQKEQQDFRIVPVRLKNADVKKLLRAVSWLDVPGEFTSNTALGIIRGLYNRPNLPNPAGIRDVYISASWQTDTRRSISTARQLMQKGFRLIGDMKDQINFDLNRIRRIMETCGAFVGIVPFREQAEASATQRPYKYFLQEIDVAASLQLPALVIADPRIKRVDGDDGKWLRMSITDDDARDDLTRQIDFMWEEWDASRFGNHIFLATSQETAESPRAEAMRAIIEVVTGMNVIIGTDLRGQDQSKEIQSRIQTAALVIADISSDNVNVCIEAGMAKISGRPYELLSEGPKRSGPFMIRGPNIAFFQNDLELYGALHCVARAHRRRIINSEIR